MRKKLLQFGIKATAMFVLAIGVSVAAAPSAHAWDAGHIIDDSVFNNTSAMSVQDIQNFLNSKVPSCDTYHSPNPAYSQGANPPWTCLKDYNEGGLSAAQIIYNAAQQYSLNPQVLLVTLQKENGLITDTWPYPWQYRTAMGFACPDTAACDPNYYGFTKQVQQGARHLRNFQIQTPGWTIPHRPGVNFIAYNPNGGCGGTNVNIVNGATAALYSYTPYQPNAAALATKYGGGDGCSAYGNRNFYNYFTDWFGDPAGGNPYPWQLVGQRVIKYGTSQDLDISQGVAAGERMVFYIQAKNTGSLTWNNTTNNPVRIGTTHGDDRTSVFCEVSWVACHRPVAMVESSVAPGEVGTFQFAVQAPATPGTYNEYFNPLIEGVSRMQDIGLYFNIKVNPLNFNYTVLGDTLPTQLASGATGSGVITLRNDSNVTWFNTVKYPIRIGSSGPPDRQSRFVDSSWVGQTRLANQNEFMVAPGQQATFNVTLKAPENSGVYNEALAPVAEGIQWANQTFTHTVTVKQAYDATLDSSSTSAVTMGGVDRTLVTLKYLNTGLQTWTNSGPNPIRIGTAGPDDRTSGFCDSGTWIACHRPAVLTEASVAPGQVGTFQFYVEGRPYHASNPYTETFRPLKEGVTRFGPNAQVRVNYTHQSYGWQLTDQYAYVSSANRTPVSMTNMTPGQTIFIGFKAKNTGSATWYNTGDFPLRVATTHPIDRASSFCDSGSWIACHRPAKLVEGSVAPGQTGTFEFNFKAPATAGNYNEYFVPVVEAYSYLNDIGLYYSTSVH